jgi:P4 family phage/plasmid primase-like protien
MSTAPKKRGPLPIMPMADAGKDKFDEAQYASSFMRKAPPILAKGDDWFAYDGKCWRPRSKDTFRSLSMEVLPVQHQRARHSKAIRDHVEEKRQCTAEMEFRSAVAWDGDSVLVNVNNGVLRVTAESVTVEPHSKDLMFTGCLGANWNGIVETPLFTKTLHEVLHDYKDIALFQWFAGYCLYPDSKQHEVFLICYGPGGTGKSTLADAIVNAFSDDVLVTRLSLAQICSSGPGSYSLPGLQTALVNLGTELDTVEMDESANFKQIVSGEPIVARSIYGKPFKMQTTCKLWFLSNALPRFKSGTDAEYRRARFLAFDKKPVEKDPTLKDKLRLERDGILGWLVDGLQAIMQGFPAPAGGSHSTAVLKRFELSNDPVGCFIRETCVLSPELRTPKEDVIDAFTEFLDAHQFPHRTREYFFRALYERNPNITVSRHVVNGQQKRFMNGIGLK